MARKFYEDGRKQEEIAEEEGVTKETVSQICQEMAKLPKSDKSYADFDLMLKGEDYDREGVEGKRPLYNVWRFSRKSEGIEHFGNSEPVGPSIHLERMEKLW